MTDRIERLIVESQLDTDAKIDYARNMFELQRRLWRSCGEYQYTLPEDQLPYLASISLEDVTLGQICLPCECVKFLAGTVTAYVVDIRNVAGIEKGVSVFFEQVVAGDGLIISQSHSTQPEELNESLDAWMRRAWSGFHSDSPLADDVKVDMERNQRRVLAAIITTLFLSELHPEYFRLDVFRKDRAAYDEARRRGDQERMDTIEARAKRKREQYTFHTGSSWISDVENPGDPVHYWPQAKGGEHSYRYITKGHFRRQRVGPGRSQVKVLLIPPTIKRPDLPPRARLTMQAV